MPDYSPIYHHGERWTAVLSTAVIGGQCLVVTGSDTVGIGSATPTSNLNNFVGVAAHDGKIGEPVTVLSGGIHQLTAAVAITAGALVGAATGGGVAVPATGDAVIGIALNTAANGAKVKVKLFRQ